MKILVVVDMQNDFIDGSLGTAEAVAIVPHVIEKIKEYEKNGDTVIYTKDTHFDDYLNTSSVIKLEGCKVEPSLAEAEPSDKFQFVRCGYFVKDTKHKDTFNRIVGLKDSFPKAAK